MEGFNTQAVQALQKVVLALDSESVVATNLSEAQGSSAVSADRQPLAATHSEGSAPVLAAIDKVQEVVSEETVPPEVFALTVEAETVTGPAAADIPPEPLVPVAETKPIMAPEPDVEKAEPAVFSVDEALRHLHWADSKEEAQQAFRISYDHYSQVPRYVAEAVALHWIEEGHLNVAYQILRDANESTLLSDRVLDASLLRSAFYGMNLWPKDREALSYTQRDLNLLNHKDLEDQLERKPTGKIVPYLIVCATLQPALFAGGETQAATLLKLAANHFDDHLSRLITDSADFVLRGGRLDLDILRNVQAQETHLAAAKLQDQVNTWVELNQQRTNRWHALRLALRSCIKHPIIGDAIAAIKAGEQGDSVAVRVFVNTYSTHTESCRLLDDLVVEIRADAPVNDHIDTPAYTTF